jgi:general secretion pathway protein C
MTSRPGRPLIHWVGAVLAFVQLAYWTMRPITPPRNPAPVHAHAPTRHDPDAVLLARAFGQVEPAAPAALAHIHVAGVYAGGADSAAVFVMEDGPARAVRLGEEVAPGSVLIEVDAQGVTLDSGGARRQFRLPDLPAATSSRTAAAPGAGFDRHLPATSGAAALPVPHRAGARSHNAIVPPRPEPKAELTPELLDRREIVGTSADR